MKTKNLNFKQAVEYVFLGYKVKRKRWLKNDFIYMNNNIIYCDGEYEYITYLKNADFKANDWEVVDI